LLNEEGDFYFDPAISNCEDFCSVRFTSNPPFNYANMLRRLRRERRDTDAHIVHYSYAADDYKTPRERVSAFSYFAPLKAVVAVTIYYTDFKSYELERVLKRELKEGIAGQRIGETGYIWVFNSKGDYVVSKDRLRDGESVIDVIDQDGEPVVKNIIEKSLLLQAKETAWLSYSWRNIGESTPNKKLSAFVYVPQWDWIIGASAYEDEYLAVLKPLALQIAIVCLVFILIGACIANVVASIITRPIKQLEKASQHAAHGDLGVAIDITPTRYSDEISHLTSSFSTMIANLKRNIEQIRAAQNALEAGNSKLALEIVERERAQVALDKKNKALEMNEEILHSTIVNLQRTHEDLKDAQQQLLLSGKMAGIGQLAAGVAHEINNPTGYIMTNLEVLKENAPALISALTAIEELYQQEGQANVEQVAKLTHELQEVLPLDDLEFLRDEFQSMVDDCLEGTRRIKTIVLNLKEFSHPGEAGFIETDINEEIERTLALAHNELKYRCEVEKNLGDIPRITANPSQIDQVLINLFVNAAHAFEEKGLLQVSTSADENDVYIRIKDNGVGIAEENLDKLFNPFFTTREVGQGTGLGLSITYRIIADHGGNIDVKSVVGEGTEFIITLPIRQGEESQ
jgi:signal transduction histidine kinase